VENLPIGTKRDRYRKEYIQQLTTKHGAIKNPKKRERTKELREEETTRKYLQNKTQRSKKQHKTTKQT